MRFILLLSLVGIVSAHTAITQVIVNGNADSSCIRPQFPASEWQTGIGYQSPISNLYAPVMDGLMSTNYTCGFMPYAAQPAAGKCSVQAGTQIQVQFYHGGIAGEGPLDIYIASAHKGPILAYMARHEQTGGIPSGPVWFKVFQADIIQYGGGTNTPNKWASNDLLNANGGRININIPSDIQAGNYILRTELIAYHDGRDRGRQPYVNCAEITVTGGGSATPGGASFPGSYDWSDPALRYSIYTADPKAAYPTPGNIPMYVPGNAPPPSPPAPAPAPVPLPSGANVLTSYGEFGPSKPRGGALYSPSNNHVALMQEDGNLVVYTYPAFGIVWASGSYNSGVSGPYWVSAQDDGNLVIYADGYKPIWSTGTWGQGVAPFALVMQDDGNLVYYDSTLKAIWNTLVVLGDVGLQASPPLLNNGTSTGGDRNVSVNPNYNPAETTFGTTTAASTSADVGIVTGIASTLQFTVAIAFICLLFALY